MPMDIDLPIDLAMSKDLHLCVDLAEATWLPLSEIHHRRIGPVPRVILHTFM